MYLTLAFTKAVVVEERMALVSFLQVKKRGLSHYAQSLNLREPFGRLHNDLVCRLPIRCYY